MVGSSQFLAVCPIFWQFLQRIGFGMYSLTLTLYQEMSTLVTRITPEGLVALSMVLVNLNTECTFWARSSFTISSSGMWFGHGAYINPFTKLKDSW